MRRHGLAGAVAFCSPLLHDGGGVMLVSVDDEAGFIRSSFCSVGGCVEVAPMDSDKIAIRDSGRPTEVIVVSRIDWQLFVAGVRQGDFDAL